MALIGKGVLAIWNGIAPAAEDEFVAWHVREHIPERVALPGFLRGRRYVALDGQPKYFNFYETATADDLCSAAYHAALNAPSPWTKAVVAHFTDTSRTICDVAWSMGIGEGGWIEAIMLETSVAAEPFKAAIRTQLDGVIAASPGIIGLHLLQGRVDAGRGATAEKELRGVPDKVASWILLVEASRPEAIHAFRQAAGSSGHLKACGADGQIVRGLYQLQFGLTKTELHM